VNNPEDWFSKRERGFYLYRYWLKESKLLTASILFQQNFNEYDIRLIPIKLKAK